MSSSVGIFASQISGHLFTLSGSYDALASVTVPSGGVSSVTFAGIPTGYSHLQIRSINRISYSENDDTMFLRFNTDTGSSYSFHNLIGLGSSTAANGAGSQTSIQTGRPTGNNLSSGIFSACVIDILDYTNTNKNKTTRCLSGWDSNGNGDIRLTSGAWYSTSAINTLSLTAGAGQFMENSQFALYGVK